MSSVPTLVLVFLNAFSALLWAVAIGSGGYLFERALELALGKIKTYEIIVGACLALVVLFNLVDPWYSSTPEQPGLKENESRPGTTHHKIELQQQGSEKSAFEKRQAPARAGRCPAGVFCR